MSAQHAVAGIVVRDLRRAGRQTGRLLGGVARPLLWLVLVGTGYSTIAHVEGFASYRTFVLPGIVIMAVLFGAMLTAVSTVYDREFGMLRLMLASPAGIPAVLAGRTIAAAAVGVFQGGVVLLVGAIVVPVSAEQAVAATGALGLSAMLAAVLGLAVAAPMRSVENFAGVINVVLFPLLFLSGALYRVAPLPPVIRLLAQANPVTYAVDLMRHALGQPGELAPSLDIGVIAVTTVAAALFAAVRFDPERRLLRRTTERTS